MRGTVVSVPTATTTNIYTILNSKRCLMIVTDITVFTNAATAYGFYSKAIGNENVYGLPQPRVVVNDFISVLNYRGYEVISPGERLNVYAYHGAGVNTNIYSVIKYYEVEI